MQQQIKIGARGVQTPPDTLPPPPPNPNTIPRPETQQSTDLKPLKPERFTPKNSEIARLVQEHRRRMTVVEPWSPDVLPQANEEEKFDLAALENKIQQLAAKKSYHAQELNEIILALNEALHREPCLRLEDLQTRIAQLKGLLTESKKISDAHHLTTAINQHLIHAQQAVSGHHQSSAVPSLSWLWPLNERILNLPTLKPDPFGAALALLRERLPCADQNHPVVQQLQSLASTLCLPTHRVRLIEPYEMKMHELKSINLRCKAMLLQLKCCPQEYLQTLVPLLEVIVETHQNLIDSLNQARTEEERAALLEPRAQISGVALGFFTISQQMAQALLCKDPDGKPRKENASGNHPVREAEDVFYKPNPVGMNFIDPATEIAIDTLYSLIDETTAAPTTMVKVSGVFFEKQEKPFGRVLQAGYGIKGMSLEDYLAMPKLLVSLKSIVGEARVNGVFKRLFEENWAEKALKQCPDLLSQERFEGGICINMYAPQIAKVMWEVVKKAKPDERLAGFDENGPKAPFEQTISRYLQKHSLDGLYFVISVIEAFPELMKSRNNRQVSIHDILDIYKVLQKIKGQFPRLSADRVLQMLPTLAHLIDPANLSAHAFSAVLHGPTDHKTDNLFVVWEADQEAGTIKPGTVKIVGIDNDQAFGLPISYSNHKAYPGWRTVIFCMPGVDHPIPEQTRRVILARTPEQWVMDWAGALVDQNRRYIQLQMQNIIEEGDLFEDNQVSLNIPLTIPEGILASMYQKIDCLQNALKRNPTMTSFQLFETVEPELAKAYRHVIKTTEEPQDAISKIFHDPIPGLGGDKEDTPLPPPGVLPSKAFEAFWKVLPPFAELSLERQVHLAGKVFNSFPEMAKKINLPGTAENAASRKFLFLLAVEKGYHALVAHLLKEEADAFARLQRQPTEASLTRVVRDRKENGLMIACQNGDVPMLNLLIQQGTALSDRDADGQTCLVHCLKQFDRHPERVATAIRCLGEHRDCLFNAADKDGYTPLHHLVLRAQSAPEHAEPLIKYLVEKGANPDLFSAKGETPLDLAIRLGNERVVIQLIAMGAGRNLKIAEARQFFGPREELRGVFEQLIAQSLPLRWELACEALQRAQDNSATYVLESGKTGRIQLNATLCSQLFDRTGDLKTDSSGRRVVRLTLPGGVTVFVKQGLDMPGVEFMVGSLLERLIGHGASRTELFKVTTPSGRSYPVLVSLGIEGDTLHNVLRHADKKGQLKALDLRYFWELFLAFLVINPEDANPGNFIVETLPDGRKRLVGIDNDHAFISSQVKNILNCFDWMNQVIDKRARELFRAIDFENTLLSWLSDLEKQNSAYLNLFTETERKALYNNDKTLLSMPFKDGDIRGMYQIGRRIQRVLASKQNLTGLQLLRAVDSELGARYEEAFYQKTTALERFDFLSTGQYKRTSDGGYTTTTTTQNLLKSQGFSPQKLVETPAQHSPAIAVKELNNVQREMQQQTVELKGIRDQLQTGNVAPFIALTVEEVWEKVVNGVDGEFDGIDFGAMKSLDKKRQKEVLKAIITKGGYRYLHLKGCSVLEKSDVENLLKKAPHLQYLFLDGCPQVEDATVRSIARYAPLLDRLDLRNLSSLKDIVLEHKTLRDLRLVDCPSARKVSLKTPDLKSLQLNNCEKLIQLETKTPNLRLKHFTLRLCPILSFWATELKCGLSETELKLRDIPFSPKSREEELELLRAVLLHPRRAACFPSVWGYYRPSFEEILKLVNYEERPELLDVVLPLYATDSPGLAPKDNRSQTPLHIAAKYGRTACIKPLIKQFKAMDCVGCNAFHAAVKAGHIETVCALIQEGVDPFALTSEGENALHLCATNEQFDLLQQIIARATETGNLLAALHQGDADGKTPLHKAVWGTPKPAIVEELLKAGTKPNCKNKFGYTPLHWAAKHGHIVSARRLLHAGADQYPININGDTPVDLAIRFKQPDTARYLGNIDDCLRDLNKIRESHQNSPHPDVAEWLARLGSCYRAHDDRTSAIKYYEESLTMQRKLIGDKPSVRFLRILEYLIELYHEEGNTTEAKRCEQELTLYPTKPAQ